MLSKSAIVNKKLKVLLLAIDFPPSVGGIQRIIYNFAKYTNFDIKVIASYTKGAKEADNKEDFIIVRINASRLKIINGILFLLKSTILLHKFKPDIIFCAHIFLSPVCYIFNILFSIPYVVYVYGIELARKHFLFFTRRAKRIIALSEYTKNYLIKNGVNEEKIVVCYPTIDEKFFKKVDYTELMKKYQLENKRILLTVARLEAKERYKGYDTIIKYMHEIIKEVPNAIYLIVGDGSDRARVDKLINEYNLSNFVKLVGRVSDDDLIKFYSLCDLFVMPSKEEKDKFEGFGLVYIEAGARGKPVVATKSGGNVEAIIDAVTGYIVKEEDLVKTIIKLLKDDELRKIMGKKAREIVKEKFNVNKIVNEIDKILLDAYSNSLS